MKQVLEETIDYLNKNNFEYFFEFNDIHLPLPASGVETHHEMLITRTKRQSNKRQRLVSFTYSCHPEEAAELSEIYCNRIVFDLLGSSLYHSDPDYKPPRY